MIDIAVLRAMARPEQMAVTEHGRQRLLERGLTIADVMSCIASGEIIHQYEDDKPFPSCLLLGPGADGQPIHSVLSHDEAFIYLITAYSPDRDIWAADLRTKRRREP